MKETKITCDHCGEDLTTSTNGIDWRIALLNENIPSCGGMVTAMMIYPKLSNDYYFCGSRCLKEFVNKNL